MKLLCYINVMFFLFFYWARWKATWNQPDGSSHWITMLSSLKEGGKGFFLYPATFTAYTFTIDITVAYWEFILKTGWEQESDLSHTGARTEFW